MCQPGNPVPHGAGQVSSRPPAAPFHSAQSAWNRLLAPSTSPPEPVPGPQVGEPVAGQLAVAGERARVEVHRPVGRRVGVPGLDQAWRSCRSSGRSTPTRAASARRAGCSARSSRRGTRPRRTWRAPARSGPRPGPGPGPCPRRSGRCARLRVVGEMTDVGDVLAGQDREVVPVLGVAPDQVGEQVGSAGCRRARSGRRWARRCTSAAGRRAGRSARPAWSACRRAGTPGQPRRRARGPGRPAYRPGQRSGQRGQARTAAAIRSSVAVSATRMCRAPAGP